MEIFAKRLKELREENKLSLKELAKKINVSDVAISRWENMQRIPTIETLYNIAKYFGVTSDYLIGLED